MGRGSLWLNLSSWQEAQWTKTTTAANAGGRKLADNNLRNWTMSETKKAGLDLLREPFPAHQISKLPKGTKAQNDCPSSEKVNCKVCGGWHHPKIIHLDYVGHAALTDRLLDADPLWYWEPMAFKDGLPAFDETGGLWIRLTVCGHSRIGYGHAAGSSYKDIGAREKEVIGDALRNAAMRFGAALELWHKGELHLPEEDAKEQEPAKISDEMLKKMIASVNACEALDQLQALRDTYKADCEDVNDAAAYGAVISAVKAKVAELTKKGE